MKKSILALCLLSSPVFAQYQVSLVVDQSPNEPIILNDYANINQEVKFQKLKNVKYIRSITKTEPNFFGKMLGESTKQVKHTSFYQVGLQGQYTIKQAPTSNIATVYFFGQLIESNYAEFNPTMKKGVVSRALKIKMKNGHGCMDARQIGSSYFQMCLTQI